MNIVGFDTIAVQVVPTLVRPKLRALLWCEEAGQFVACNATAFIEPPYIVPFQINTPKVYNGIMLIEITNADGGPFPMGARVKILMGGLAGQYIPPLPTGGL